MPLRKLFFRFADAVVALLAGMHWQFSGGCGSCEYQRAHASAHQHLRDCTHAHIGVLTIFGQRKTVILVIVGFFTIKNERNQRLAWHS